MNIHVTYKGTKLLWVDTVFHAGEENSFCPCSQGTYAVLVDGAGKVITANVDNITVTGTTAKTD